MSPKTSKRRDMGLGSYPTVSIRDARTNAFEAQQKIEDGIDPLEERQAEEEYARKKASIPSFEEAARSVHADLSLGFRNGKHASQWINTLGAHIFPKLGKRPVNELDPWISPAALSRFGWKNPRRLPASNSDATR